MYVVAVLKVERVQTCPKTETIALLHRQQCNDSHSPKIFCDQKVSIFKTLIRNIQIDAKF